MAMFTAAEILQRHPQGCWVFDARGRRLDSVFACNPQTGEVVMWSQARSPLDWLLSRSPRRRPLWPWLWRGCVPRRHGFWPAPLHLAPKPAPPAAWPAGPICDSQRYIVGNGDREELLP